MPEIIEENIPSMADVAAQFNASEKAGKPISAMGKEELPPPAPAPKPDDKPPETKPDPKPPEAKPTPPKEPAKEPSPTAKLLKKDKPAAPAEAPKPDEEKAYKWETAPKEFRERHEKLLTEHKTVTQKAQDYEKRVTEYEQKIKDIEAKSGDTSKADLKLVEEYTKKISDYEAKVRELDYSQSQEYTSLRDSYQEKYSQRYIKAAGVIKEFQVTTGRDADNNPVTRQANEADLKMLMAKSEGEQERLAQEMFGPYANAALRHLNGLREIQDEANFTLTKKLEEARTQGELRAKEQKLSQAKQQDEYKQLVETHKKQIETEWPDVFGEPKDDPEALTAYQSGKEFVHNALSNTAKMTPQERAEHNAVLETIAASHWVRELRENRLKAENESLKKELEGLRGSDPGNGGARPKPNDAPTDEVGGINEMANRILLPPK